MSGSGVFLLPLKLSVDQSSRPCDLKRHVLRVSERLLNQFPFENRLELVHISGRLHFVGSKFSTTHCSWVTTVAEIPSLSSQCHCLTLINPSPGKISDIRILNVSFLKKRFCDMQSVPTMLPESQIACTLWGTGLGTRGR